MRLNSTLFILLLFSCTANAQKLTGVWRGYFSSSNNGIYKGSTREETYKYEIQIDQQSNDGVKGVTYSYKSTVFYGKADLQGIFTGSSKSMVFKETHLVEIKVGDKSEPCLMTCYLDYSKIGKLEILEGTFISINVKDKSDCGSGKVYLEKVATSDFKLEDFLVKKKPGDSDKTTGNIFLPPKNNTTQKTDAPANKPKPAFIPPPVVNKDKKDNATAKVTPLKPRAPAQEKPTIVPSKKNPPVVKDNSAKTRSGARNTPSAITPRIPENTQEEKTTDSKKTEQVMSVPQANQTQKMNIPKVLTERENKLEKVFNTSEEEIDVAIFDNGEIDNDTISVYLDNQLVVSHGRLTKSPIMIRIKSSRTNSHHELVIVAENLGEIPPNTALMVINPNKRDRTEIFLASTEQRNAKVVINYIPKE
jgi:hypothetical protein